MLAKRQYKGELLTSLYKLLIHGVDIIDQLYKCPAQECLDMAATPS
jgi:hypothetical protein